MEITSYNHHCEGSFLPSSLSPQTKTTGSIEPSLLSNQSKLGFGLSGDVHRLSEPQQDTLADALKSLKQGVSRRLIGDAAHFWQKRYYDFNVRNHQQFVEKLRYIHRNPVKRGLCERAEDWQWSSFRHYATGAEGRVEIESEWTARKRERAAGTLCPAVELPHSKPKPGLNGPPANFPE
jgi:hypothetical protein